MQYYYHLNKVPLNEEDLELFIKLDARIWTMTGRFQRNPIEGIMGLNKWPYEMRCLFGSETEKIKDKGYIVTPIDKENVKDDLCNFAIDFTYLAARPNSSEKSQI